LKKLSNEKETFLLLSGPLVESEPFLEEDAEGEVESDPFLEEEGESDPFLEGEAESEPFLDVEGGGDEVDREASKW